MKKSDKAILNLIKALTVARAEAEKHINDDDGGTCNFDTALLKRPKEITKADFENAIDFLGLRCRYDNYKNSYGRGFYHIFGYQSGQGNRHTAMAEAFSESLKRAGYEADMYYQMD